MVALDGDSMFALIFQILKLDSRLILAWIHCKELEIKGQVSRSKKRELEKQAKDSALACCSWS